MIKTIFIEGSFFAPSGYSSATREFTHEFIKQYGKQYQIILGDIQWDQVQIQLGDKYKDTIMSHICTGEEVDFKSTMLLRWGIPLGFDDGALSRTPFRVKALYFVWELDRLPPTWVDRLQQYNVIFTVSKFSANSIKMAIKERGWDIPVIIIPHGFADTYHVIPDHKKVDDKFTFMYVGTIMPRKAPIEMINAYVNTFTKDDNVRLIVKAGNIHSAAGLINFRREIQKQLFYDNRDNAPDLILDANTYDPEVLNILYNNADCLIQVSRGEAWNLPVLDGMATGTPSLILDKGGQRAFANGSTSFLVKSNGLSPSHGQGFYDASLGMRWLNIDEEDFGKKMRLAYEDAKKLKTRSDNGLGISKKFTWEKVVRHANNKFKGLFKDMLINGRKAKAVKKSRKTTKKKSDARNS